MARHATNGAIKNRPSAKMRRTNWSIEAGFSGECPWRPWRTEEACATESTRLGGWALARRVVRATKGDEDAATISSVFAGRSPRLQPSVCELRRRRRRFGVSRGRGQRLSGVYPDPRRAQRQCKRQRRPRQHAARHCDRLPTPEISAFLQEHGTCWKYPDFQYVNPGSLR
jgi:hypothetical protein